MRYGVSPPPRSTAGLVEKAREAEDVGLDLVGISDSQCVFRELYTTLGAVAAATESISIGPVVTNPITRHPTVTAGALATLDEFADGRAFMGISTGDSAVYTIGERPARLAELEGTITALKSLWAGDEIDLDDASARVRWLAEAGDARDIPVYVAAEGPKTLRMAGATADGVLVGLGLTNEIVEGAAERIAAGARAADRDPDDVDVWVFAKGHIADDREVAVDEMKMALAASAHHSLQFSMDEKFVPDEYRDRLERLVDEYDSHEHEQSGATTNRELVESMDLTDYLADRYGILGTPDDCIDAIERIAGTGLVDGILFSAYGSDEDRFIHRLGAEVLPNVP